MRQLRLIVLPAVIVMVATSLSIDKIPLQPCRTSALQVDSHPLSMHNNNKKRETIHTVTRRNMLTITGTLSAMLIRQIANAADNNAPKVLATKNKRVGGLADKIRGIGYIMDELQRDLMQERWADVETYPQQLRSYVPLLTTYTDSAFPSDAPTDKGLRVALRYEVGRFFASLERFKQATSRQALDEAYVAYSDMALHFDRYLRVGGLYSYYDSTIDLERYYQDIDDKALVYANPKKDPPLVRDLIILIKGPDKGRTGIMIGKYADGSGKIAIKLDRFKGIREIRLVPEAWVAKRLGEQEPDDVFLIPRKPEKATS
ncbi:hypothetical protein MPSEU_000254100 [Mayamaea pseudoterrestris]|nr:hypothetical protein MPSEU_000254100 [Mayamaea pseudoterrestris]